MSSQEKISCVSKEAGADLSALQFTAVKYGSDKAIVSATSNNEPILGILQNKPSASGQAASVAIAGIGKALVGAGGWSSGDMLTATTGGALIATTTNNHQIVGIADEDANAGDYARVNIRPGQVGA